MVKYIYTGPSWAARSYETPDGSEDNFTNLALEWQIPYFDLAKRSQCNASSLSRLRQHKGNLPIIFVLAEPLMDIDITIFNTKSQCEDFLLTNSIHEFRDKLLQQTLMQLNQLEVPVGLIGGHTDIMPNQITGYENLSIIDSQWQQFLSDLSIKKIINGWGPDVAHRIMTNHQLINITPSENVVDNIINHFDAWHHIEQHDTNLFTGCHPSRRGNELYAKYLKERVANFIETNTKE